MSQQAMISSTVHRNRALLLDDVPGERVESQREKGKGVKSFFNRIGRKEREGSSGGSTW